MNSVTINELMCRRNTKLQLFYWSKHRASQSNIPNTFIITDVLKIDRKTKLTTTQKLDNKENERKSY